MKGIEPKPPLTRRQIMTLGASGLVATLTPLSAFAEPEDMRAAQKEMFGDRPIQIGRVTLALPPIAENGYSVPIEINVDSPMSPDDYVKTITVFSPRNPLPVLASFHLTPHSGRASVSTRIRMGGTQVVTVVAEMNDGSLWSGTAETLVTLAACVIL